MDYEYETSDGLVVDAILAGRAAIDELVRQLLEAIAEAADARALGTVERCQGASAVCSALLRSAIREVVPTAEAGLHTYLSSTRIIEDFAMALAVED